MNNSRAILIILDGFGIGKPNDPFNAIRNARMPFYKNLAEKNPTAQIITHGEAVGLPAGVMGNSEVGHMTLGAGRIIYQDLSRIARAIEDKTFFKNKAICDVIEAGKKKTGRVHFMGLLSDGGVHSHMNHLWALLDLCVEMNVPHVSVHAFMDGRDTPPSSGASYMKKLLEHPAFSAHGKNGTKAEIATIEGRYWVMDRDKRWDRVSKAYAAMTGKIPATPMSPVEALEKSYSLGKNDEFIEPVLLSKEAAIQDGDSVFFYNYRSDRAREITEALTAPDFNHFERGSAPRLSGYAGMAVYDQKWTQIPAAFPPQSMDNILGAWLEQKGRSQLRLAETEKYAHVTFFFNGGREKPFKDEDRILIDSPKEVATYDLKPEMSAKLVCETAVQKIAEQKYDFILINFANPDMVGHTGIFSAVVQALEALDECLTQVVGAAVKAGYHMLVTADHGNADQMRDESGQPHTQHTLNPVPITWIAPEGARLPTGAQRELRSGGLQDVMPTLCDLMGLEQPVEATGKSLLVKN